MDAHPMALGPSCAPAVVLIVEDEMMLRMRQTLGKQLKGDVQLTYASTGFIYAFDVPIASVTSSAA